MRSGAKPPRTQRWLALVTKEAESMVILKLVWPGGMQPMTGETAARQCGMLTADPHSLANRGTRSQAGKPTKNLVCQGRSQTGRCLHGLEAYILTEAHPIAP